MKVATSTLNADWQDIAESSFGERDADVLNLISEEDLALFTFDGLKRRMGLHPETLSRILGRLEQEGIVEKGHGGYRVTSKIDELLGPHPTCSDQSRVPLLQTFLPSDMSVQKLASHLRGRWFGLLRWLGLSEGNAREEVTLKWITEDGGIQVDANVSDRALTIEAKFLHDKDLNMALRASYQLVAYIGKLCSSSHLIRRAAYVGDFDVHLTPA
jgi:DNA-binding transcriptional regulator YhcF (GntR family)